MVKNLLSNEVSNLSILVKSHQTLEDLQTPIKRWQLQAQFSKCKAYFLDDLALHLLEVIEDSQKSGSKLSKYLCELNKFIRSIERFQQKVLNVQQTYAFQGAVTIMLPWFVVFLFFKLKFNILILLGIFMQVFGTLAFSWILHNALKLKHDEKKFLLEKSLKLWGKSFSCNNFFKNLEDTFGNQKQNPKNELGFCADDWFNWFSALSFDLKNINFQFQKKFSESQNYSKILQNILYTGVDSSDVLYEFSSRYMDEWIIESEYRLMMLPNQIILLFCFLLGPSAMFIILGALWPLISNQI